MFPCGIRETAGGRIAIFQVWDFLDASHYDMSMFFIHDIDAAPRTQVFRTRFHAILLPELENLLTQAGFQAVERVVDGFFQPILVATNPGRA